MRQLYTKNLILKKMNKSDRNNFVSHVVEAGELYIQFGSEPSEALIDCIREPTNGVIYYSMVLKSTKEMVGYIGVLPETDNVEFYVFREYRRNGYAYEALLTITIAYLNGAVDGSSHDSITAETLIENSPSIALLEIVGYRKQATALKSDPLNPGSTFACCRYVFSKNRGIHDSLKFEIKKGKYGGLKHGQIPTQRRFLMDELMDNDRRAFYALLKCLVSEPGSREQKIYLLLAALIFERISRPVYLNKDLIISKLPVERYYMMIFTGYAETPEEVFERVKRDGVTREKAEHIFKLVWQIADIVCPMMACPARSFVYQYAQAIEYVINHNGDLPKPEISHLYPKNYPHYSELLETAREIEEYELI